MNDGNLPGDFGTFRNFDGDTVNWPIPWVVMMNRVADLAAGGGSLEYDRTSVEAAFSVPDNMS